METNRKLDWKANFENLEDRFLMSADPIGGPLGGAISHHQDFDGSLVHHLESTPDFWIEETDEQLLHQELEQIEQALANAHNLTGQSQVVADYGFDGSGQTVAIIDSGIAYDHFALGGGFGDGYRVVGGWDFTGENDADPYDDGPSGSHGTHVAGIVGASSSSGSHQGVATGVDLVGLRVFDDAGAGYFSWVENALQWIHTNRNNFDNPITTVNLSLGTNYNSDTVPNWAMLEDEFAQLEADGIFIAVSAGNSFTSYNMPGLSYPAASSHVVPVMSQDDNGNLSYFSQRHSRAIAAPGRTIVSTVPDYAGNGNGITDDWASFSGTSMAAPYLAGASALIREAMEFVGYANITQDTIYDHIVDTADSIWDSATNASYNSLNLEAAIDALMPTDDFGSSFVSAFDLGTITDTDSISGLISTLDDSDYFSFTSGVTGTVTFTASNMTHDLQAAWQLVGGGGEVSGSAGETFTIDVVAGQDYTFSFSSADGLGYYDFDISSEASFSFIDLGAITFNELEGTSSVDEQWYRIETANAGFISVEGFFDTANGQISLHLFDSDMNEIGFGVGNGAAGIDRVDTYAAAGEELFVCVLGTNADIDLRMSNLVSLDGTTVQVTGTEGDDVFSFTAGSSAHTVTVNAVTYEFATIAVSNVNFEGGGGNDSITMTGTAGDESATLRVGNATFTGTGFAASALGVENVYAYGGGGIDQVITYDSVGDDTYNTWSDHIEMTGTGFLTYASGFQHTYAYSFYGTDSIVSYDSEGNDTYKSWSDRVLMTGAGYSNYAYGFDHTYAYSLSGTDSIISYDSTGDDLYKAWLDRVLMTGDGFSNYAYGFAHTFAYSFSGNDEVYVYDSVGDDMYKAWSDKILLTGSGFISYAYGFDETYAYFTSGNDTLIVYDSAGDDVYRAWSDKVLMTGSGYLNYAYGFDQTYAYSSSGNDIAIFYDSAGNDLYESWFDRSQMSGNGFFNYAHGFRYNYSYSFSGIDSAFAYDSEEDDLLEAFDWGCRLTSPQSLNQMYGFDSISAVSDAGGDDEAYVEASDYLFDLIGDWQAV